MIKLVFLLLVSITISSLTGEKPQRDINILRGEQGDFPTHFISSPLPELPCGVAATGATFTPACLTHIATRTLSTETPTQIPTFVSINSFKFILFRDAVCRAGPSLDYKITEYISNGTVLTPEARSADLIWLVVTLPNGVRCWVSSQIGNLDGDPSLLPVEQAALIVFPATPTEDSGDEPACVEQTTCGQNEIYDGCNCVPLPPP